MHACHITRQVCQLFTHLTHPGAYGMGSEWQFRVARLYGQGITIILEQTVPKEDYLKYSVYSNAFP